MSIASDSGSTPVQEMVTAVASDRLNNVLTALALNCGILAPQVQDQSLVEDVKQIEKLASESVMLLRQIVPAP